MLLQWNFGQFLLCTVSTATACPWWAGRCIAKGDERHSGYAARPTPSEITSSCTKRYATAWLAEIKLRSCFRCEPSFHLVWAEGRLYELLRLMNGWLGGVPRERGTLQLQNAVGSESSEFTVGQKSAAVCLSTVPVERSDRASRGQV